MELSRDESLFDQATPPRVASFFASFFLSETKNTRSFLQDFQVSFGYNKLFTMEPDGRNGGLALFYLDAYDVSIHNYDKRMIDIISATIEDHTGFITFV